VVIIREGKKYYIGFAEVRFAAVARLVRAVRETKDPWRSILMLSTAKGTSAFLRSVRASVPWLALIVRPDTSDGKLWLPFPGLRPDSETFDRFSAAVLDGTRRSLEEMMPVGGASVVGEVAPARASDAAARRGVLALKLDCGFTFGAAAVGCREYHDRDGSIVSALELRSVRQSDDPRRLFSPDRFDNPLLPGEFKEWDDACRFLLLRRRGERLWDSWWASETSANGVDADATARVRLREELEVELRQFAYMGRCGILGRIKFADPRFAWT